ncbi:MAG: VOC family protein, partial [Thermomicrobiales bacterium]|nr:VOC family protein [Thermomicrobiales bacterium]MCO5222777.1 VOC family protein [Thermomicrobiales bacterium]
MTSDAIPFPRLHHVMLAIPPGGEGAARDFYIEQLGLTETEKPASLIGRGGLWLSTATLSIHLGIDPNFRSARKAHIALAYDDLDRLRSRLQDAGIAVGPIEHELPGFRRCYAEDPFGNRIELMQAL